MICCVNHSKASMRRSGVSALAILRSALRSTRRSRLSATAPPRDLRRVTTCQHGGGVGEPSRPDCGECRWRRPHFKLSATWFRPILLQEAKDRDQGPDAQALTASVSQRLTQGSGASRSRRRTAIASRARWAPAEGGGSQPACVPRRPARRPRAAGPADWRTLAATRRLTLANAGNHLLRMVGLPH
jgi:hypothetical protein